MSLNIHQQIGKVKLMHVEPLPMQEIRSLNMMNYHKDILGWLRQV